MSNLIFSQNQGVAFLKLNRPEVHNAFDDQLIEQLLDALQQCEASTEIRAVVLESEGKHFSAGADLNWMRRMAQLNESQNKLDAQALAELMYRLNSLNKPTLAKVNGAAYGGAVGLIACCDMAIATSRSQFCLSEVKIGLSPAVISPFVINAIGERQARRFFLTAEVFDAEKAHDIGLVHEVTQDVEGLTLQTQKWLDQITANAPLAVSKTKKLILDVHNKPLDNRTRDYTVDLIAGIRVSDEGQEGLSAFLEKRKPLWLTQINLNN